MLKKCFAGFCKNPTNYLFWLTIALIARAVVFYLQIHVHTIGDAGYVIPGFIGCNQLDTRSYLTPIENLLSKNSYQPDYRMPGYGVLYLPLLLLFSKATACNILICLQLLLSSVAVYCLALTVKYIFKKDAYFYIVFYLSAFCVYTAAYDAVLLTESLTTSLLVISVFYFARYYQSRKGINLFISGLIMAWVIFLRPVYGPVLFFLIFLLWYRERKFSLAFLLLIPFLFIDSIWTIRNYMLYNKIIPLTKSTYIFYSADSYTATSYRFAEAMGYGVRGNRGCNSWLMPYCNSSETPPKYDQSIFTSKFNLDSLKSIHVVLNKLYTADSVNYTQEQKTEYDRTINLKLNSYIKSIKNEKPFFYYVGSRLRIMFSFTKLDFRSILYLNRYTLLYSYLTYYFIFITGSIGGILLLRFLFRWELLLMFPIIGFYTFFIHCLVFQSDENRYLVPGFPFLLVCSAYFIYSIYSKFAGINSRNH